MATLRCCLIVNCSVYSRDRLALSVGHAKSMYVWIQINIELNHGWIDRDLNGDSLRVQPPPS